MKRRVVSNKSLGSDKRRSSLSLVEHDDSHHPSQATSSNEEDLGGNLLLSKASRQHHRVVSSSTTNLNEESSTFFIEDEDTAGLSFENHLVPYPLVPSVIGRDKQLHLAGDEDNLSVLSGVKDDDFPEASAGGSDNRTGVVFETGSCHFDRKNRLHRERPIRVTSVFDALNQHPSIRKRCTIFDGARSSGEALAGVCLDDEDYLKVHLPGYMQRLDRWSKCSCCERLDEEAAQFESVFLTKESAIEAKAAASSLCSLVRHVVFDKCLDNGFAVIRPPGHHAEPSLSSGYCIINNVAVAAAYARAKLGIGKVLIVDWDVHHGQGTQAIFHEDPNVLYFSVHRWKGFFPFQSTGGPTNVGKGAGAGYNINVGWTKKNMGDREYFAVWKHVLLPVASEFEPDLVLVSAGFDAAEGDIGECNITPDGFGCLTRDLMDLAGGRVVCALEGGYKRTVLCKCVTSVVETLLNPIGHEENLNGEEEPLGDGGLGSLDSIDPVAKRNILATTAAHEPYWRCFQRDTC